MEKLYTNNSDDFKIYKQDELSPFVVQEANKKFFNNDNKVYTEIPGGMGCIWFLRRDFKEGNILGAFLHSDCQGQYGIDHIPYINSFIRGYTRIIQ